MDSGNTSRQFLRGFQECEVPANALEVSDVSTARDYDLYLVRIA